MLRPTLRFSSLLLAMFVLTGADQAPEEPPVRPGTDGKTPAQRKDEADDSDATVDLSKLKPKPYDAWGGIHILMQPYGLITPYKWGLALSLNGGRRFDFEGELYQGSVSLKLYDLDLSSFSETLYVAKVRWYMFAGSFNLIMGYGRRDLETTVAYVASIKAIQQVMEIGIGNRFEIHRFSIGIDWLSFYWPLQTRFDRENLAGDTDSAEFDEAEKVMDKVAALPTVALFKLALGWLF